MLVSQGAAGLLLDPGLGKTSTVLAAFKVLKDAGYVKNMLIIAPLQVCHNVWPNEIRKWDQFKDLTIEVLHGVDKTRALERSADIHIINPEGLQWLFDPAARRWRDWDILCIDESTKFKDSQTKRFKLMRKHFEQFDRRWILTGTPVPNGIHDLFGQIYILDLGNSLGRFVTHFRNKFFHTNAWEPYNYIPNEGSFREIIQRIDPLVLRMSEKDYLNLPELNNVTVKGEMPKKAWDHYLQIEQDFITKVEEEHIVAANAAVAGGKCRQIANGAIYVGEGEDRTWTEIHSGKIELLKNLLDQLGGTPTLILYEFQHDKERLLKALGSKTPVLGGGASVRKTTRAVRDFNKGHIPILLGHPASMAHGLNLQESCNHVIWFGIPWNLEHYDQAIRRVYRQGQEKPVFVYHLVSEGTLDETVLEVLKAKDRDQQMLFGALTHANESRTAS
jgi:SNF2 family DNA or RNA helicase